MNRKNFLTLLAGIGAVALLAGAAIATQADTPPPDAPHDHRGPPPGGPGMMMMPGMMPPGMLPHLAKKLGLSTDQETQIKGIMEQAKPGFEKLHGTLRASMELLGRTRPDDANYASVVANASKAIGEVAGQMVTQHAEVRAKIFAVLNADQKSKLIEMEAHMHEMHGMHGGPRHHPDGPPPDGAPPPPPR